MILDEPSTLLLTGVLLGVWGAVTSLEWIVNHRLFRVGAVFDARIAALRGSGKGTLGIYPDEHGMLAVFAVRLCAALTIVVTAFLGPPNAIAVGFGATALLLGLSLFTTGRAGYGGDGSDQMGVVVAMGYLLMLAGAWSSSALTFAAGVVMNAGQLTISYCVSGVSKWLSPTWRSGIALPGVMGTHSYGHRVAATVAGSDARIAIALCWLIFVAEALFPFSIFFPPLIFQAVLACFLFFHLSNAFFMGLNAFVWSFGACYPAAILANAYLWNLHG